MLRTTLVPGPHSDRLNRVAPIETVRCFGQCLHFAKKLTQLAVRIREIEIGAGKFGPPEPPSAENNPSREHLRCSCRVTQTLATPRHWREIKRKTDEEKQENAKQSKKLKKLRRYNGNARLISANLTLERL